MDKNIIGENFKPLVSICIPVFNGADIISRAIESCLNQTYKNTELVIIDDFSTDKIRDVAARYAKYDKRVKYIQNQKNLGYLNNFFNSFQFLSGKYTQHLGHDDWLSRNYIEEGVKNFNLNPSAICVLGKIVNTGVEKGERFSLNDEFHLDSGPYSVQTVFKRFLNDNWGLGFLALFKREYLNIPALKTFYWKISEDPKYGYIYKKGAISDHYLFLEILKSHVSSSVIFTEKTSYFKLERSMSTGAIVHFDSGKQIKPLAFNRLLLTSYLYVYRDEFRKYQFGLKMYMGAIAINLFLNSIRDRLFRKTSVNINIDEEKAFFYDYSPLEKFLAPLFAIRLLGIRLWKALVKKLFKKKRIAYNENYFLDLNGQFKI